MKPFISTKFYGVINWAAVILLLTAPWDFGTWHTGFYTVGGAALFLPLFFGWVQFIMAVFSNNSHGFIKVFPMQMHLFLDLITGSFLLASPFVYHFDGSVVWPHVLLGGLLCIAAIFTQRSPVTTPLQDSLAEGQLTSTTSFESRLNH